MGFWIGDASMCRKLVILNRLIIKSFFKTFHTMGSRIKDPGLKFQLSHSGCVTLGSMLPQPICLGFLTCKTGIIEIPKSHSVVVD